MEIKTRKRVQEIPPGYTPVQVNGRCMYRCGSIVKTLDGEILRCTKCFRKSRIKDHKCNYSLSSYQDPLINNDLRKKVQIDTYENMNSLILDQLCYVSGRLDISAKKACSSGMNSFISEIRAP